MSTRTSPKKAVPQGSPAVACGSAASLAASPLVEARNSAIHGRGVYAIAPIKKGTRVLEYLGERISHAEADRRYENKGDDDGHTFLFIASNRTVIDAGVDGNDARFINHSCNPNCETVIERQPRVHRRHPHHQAGRRARLRLSATWESTDEPAELALYACRCGAKKCRGTMLDKEPRTSRQESAQKKAEEEGQEEGQAEESLDRHASSCSASSSRWRDNGVIGSGNQLPWRLPDDLKRFKALSLGKPVVMGRKTYDSIGRPLPGRLNIIVSRKPDLQIAGCQVVSLARGGLAAAGAAPEIVIVGGADIYRHALPQVATIHLTRVHADIPGDVLFPELAARMSGVKSRRSIIPPTNVMPMRSTFSTLARVAP